MINVLLPLVSVIIPTYNRASYLEETILSVLEQNYANIEYLVLDDGSTDNTSEVLRKYQDRIVWERHENMGEARTVNKGFAMAKGEFVVVVNSDDPLLPGAVNMAVEVMTKDPQALVAYPDWQEIGPNSEFIKCVRLPEYDIFTMLTTLNVAMGPGTFIRRKVFEEAGMRDLRFKYTGDLEFWFRIAMLGRIVHIPHVLATHRTHPGSLSSADKGAEMAGELVQLVQQLYQSPNMKQDLLKLRRKVFSTVHFDATYYCGTDTLAAARHYWSSFRWHPLVFFYRIVALRLTPMIMRFFPISSHKI